MAYECEDCSAGCVDMESDSCVVYTGPDIPCLNIHNGQIYTETFTRLAHKLCDHIDQTVDLQCLYDQGTQLQEAKLPEAVDRIIRKLCSLKANDIHASPDLHCIGRGSVSQDALKLAGRKARIETEPTGSGMMLNYDLREALKDLPKGFSSTGVEITVSGRKKQGKSKIYNGSKDVASIRIPNDRFPINVDLKGKVNTPSGNVDLSRSVAIPNPAQRTANDVELGVQDFTSPVEGLVTQDVVNQMISAQVCANRDKLDGILDLNIQGCDQIQYPSNDIRSIVGIQAGELCSLVERLDNVHKEDVTYTSCDDKCGEEIITTTLQSVLDNMSKRLCDEIQRRKALEDRLTRLEEKVDACCTEEGTDPEGDGGSGGGGGDDEVNIDTETV